MEQKARAWLYLRIDAPEDTSGVLELQRQQLEQYADKMNLAIVGTSKDFGNGNSMERAGLEQIVREAKKGSIDVMLTTELSRIGRNACQAMRWTEHLQKMGVSIHTPGKGELSFSLQEQMIEKLAQLAR